MTLSLSKIEKFFRQAWEVESNYCDDGFYTMMVDRGIQELRRKTEKIKKVKFMKLKKKDMRGKHKLTVKKGSLPLNES